MKKKKTLAKLKQDLQKVFNKYIRTRDEGKPCISCGQYKDLEAGHYYAVQGYDALRFDPDNVHGECAGCNRFNESHLIHYGLNLARRIGSKRYAELIDRAVQYKKGGFKWDRSEILEMIEQYKQKLAA